MAVGIALAVTSAIGVFFVFFGIYHTVAAGPEMTERLRRYGSRPGQGAVVRAERGGLASSRMVGHLDRALQKRGRTNGLALQLERADVRMTSAEFIMVSAIIASTAFIIGVILLKNPVFGLISTTAALFLPRLWLWRKRNKRLKMFNDQLADGIAMLANSLRSGYSLPQSLELAAREARPPLASEFARVNREVNLGLTPPEALANVLKRVPSDDLDLFITAVNIQREVGGNLAEVLDSIAETIRDRNKLLGEVRVLTAQQQYSGYLIVLLPICLAAAMFLISRSYMMLLFTTFLGRIMVGMALGSLTAGFFVMRAIVKIKV